MPNMANWLSDYIEMTEYVPQELREQLTSIRELDLQVHNAMDELERDIKKFFSKVSSLPQEEREKEFDALLKKCDGATRAASDKVRVADRLHDLVEKSMRLLDQGLEKLKEDLLEGDKAYVVEDLERRLQELDEQDGLDKELSTTNNNNTSTTNNSTTTNTNTNNNNSKTTNTTYHPRRGRVSKDTNADLKQGHSKSGQHRTFNNSNEMKTNHHLNINHADHNRHQFAAHQHGNSNNTNSSSNHLHQNSHITQNSHHRVRNNSTGAPYSAGQQRKRERKRLNSTMTIFNRNSRSEDDSTGQSFFPSPLGPNYLTSMPDGTGRTLGDVACNNGGHNNISLKGMIGSANQNSAATNDKSNGRDPLVGAKQPILTAIDAAHAVSPNATNSDKLVLFSSNSKSDTNHNLTQNSKHNPTAPSTTTTTNMLNMANLSTIEAQQQSQLQPQQANPYQFNDHLLSTLGFNSGDSASTSSSGSSSTGMSQHHNSTTTVAATTTTTATTTSTPVATNASGTVSSISKTNNERFNHHNHDQFTSLPLSSRHDPIMLAASQAINATQNMTPGRRTSSLKASYAAVNSGRLQPPTEAPVFDQTGGLVPEVYCKCRSQIQGSNMIGCDSKKCKIEWFHYECVGITTPPEGNWYCDDCKKSLK